MQIYNDKKKRVGVLKDFANRSITSTLDTGDKELAFEYPADGPMVEELREECYIRTKTDEFVLKAVERGEKKNKYTATLNVEDLEGTVFPGGFETVELTITDALNFAFEDTGWKVGTCEIMKRRTIRIEESTTAWAVLQQSLSTYRCECKIDSLTKTVNIYEQVGEDKGCYFMDGLNLRKLTLKSDTYDFYTRIYPIGKDGLTPFEALNVPYIENHQYSEKVKSYVWKDERYTRTTSLIEDATAKIEEMSRPYKAFTADVVDLAKRSKKYKNILSYGIGDTITLISKKNRVKEKQRIVKITEYPEHPEKNTVEISNARKTFAEIQKSEAELSKTEAIDVSNTVTKKILENGYYTKTEVESCIAATEKKITLSVGETYITKETYADGITEVKEDATAKAEKAEAAAKADTTNRLKSYSTTEEMKAAIELVAEGITSTVSKTYVTQAIYEKGIEDAKTDATTKANAAAADAKADTTNRLKSYSTTLEMESKIQQAADSITSTVSKNYVTLEEYDTGIEDVKADASQKASAAETAAKNDTTARLKSYSTTTEMKTAIQQAADSITSTVSSTYVTKADYDTGITDAKNDATTKANNAETNAKNDTASKLKSYSTTTQMNTAIKQAADSITSTVSKTYTTIKTYEGGIADAKADATTKANAAEAAAKADTTARLKSYSTTTEMNTAIKQKADSIETEVSKKVNGDEIISKINQSAESVAINASKISLNGAVTANSNFKINTDGSAEAKALKVTGGSLSIGENCEITEAGNVYALSPKFYSGLYLNNSFFRKGALSGLDYSMLLGYVGSNIYVGESGSTLWGYGFTVNNDIYAFGTIGCLGKKTRIIHTDDGRNIEMYAYETTSPTFGDMGTGKLDDDGKCYVYLDDDFLLTVEKDMKYHVMLTAKGTGELYVEKTDEKDGYFVVQGTPRLEFFWEIKTRQKGCRDMRIEQSDIPEKEDITVAEQEMLNEQMRSQMALLHEMEKDENEVRDEQSNLIERMEEAS